jgi:hypothetical protein
VLDADPDVPAYRVRSGEELVSRSLAMKRFVMQAMAGYAGLLVELAPFRRTAARVVALVVRQGLGLVPAGAGGGLFGAVAPTKVMSPLYRVSPRDPDVLPVVAAAVFLPPILSCWIPARRAVMVDPAVPLRGE